MSTISNHADAFKVTSPSDDPAGRDGQWRRCDTPQVVIGGSPRVPGYPVVQQPAKPWERQFVGGPFVERAEPGLDDTDVEQVPHAVLDGNVVLHIIAQWITCLLYTSDAADEL